MLWCALLFLPSALLAFAGAAVFYKVRRIEGQHPPRGEFVTVDGCRLHFYLAGEGLPVVLLHGTAASLEDYADVFAGLSSEFRVVAIDRPGHGHSERPKGDIGTPLAQAHVVHALLMELKIERAIIVGHSWSGALALAYALEFPAATAGVVLVEGTVYPQDAVASSSLRLLTKPVLGSLFAHMIVPFAGGGGIKGMLERAFAPEPVPPDYLQLALAMWTRPRQALAIAQDTRRRSETIEELSERYGEITVPLRLLVGAADTFIDPAGQLLRLARELPSARVEILPDAGHQIPQTRPQAVVEAVRALAREIETAAQR